MTEHDERERFRRLPEPVPPDALVETVDAGSAPPADPGDERERLLRQAGAGG